MKKELISVYDFAERKGLSHTTVYSMVNGWYNKDKTKKTREPIITGEKIGNTVYIDWCKYGNKDYTEELSVNKRRKKAII